MSFTVSPYETMLAFRLPYYTMLAFRLPYTIQCLPSNSHTMQCRFPYYTMRFPTMLVFWFPYYTNDMYLSFDSHTAWHLVPILHDLWYPRTSSSRISVLTPSTLYFVQDTTSLRTWNTIETCHSPAAACRSAGPTGSKLVLGFLTIRGDCCAGVTYVIVSLHITLFLLPCPS